MGSSWMKSLSPESTGFPYLLSCLSRKQQQQSFEVCYEGSMSSGPSCSLVDSEEFEGH